MIEDVERALLNEDPALEVGRRVFSQLGPGAVASGLMGRTDPPQGRDAELNALGSGPRGEAEEISSAGLVMSACG